MALFGYPRKFRFEKESSINPFHYPTEDEYNKQFIHPNYPPSLLTPNAPYPSPKVGDYPPISQPSYSTEYQNNPYFNIVYNAYGKLLDKCRERNTIKKSKHKKYKTKKPKKPKTSSSSSESESSTTKTKTKSSRISTSASSKSSFSSSSSSISHRTSSSSSPAPSASSVVFSLKSNRSKQKQSETSVFDPSIHKPTPLFNNSEILNRKQHYGKLLKDAYMDYLEKKPRVLFNKSSQFQPHNPPATAAFFKNSKMLNSQDDLPANLPPYGTNSYDATNFLPNRLKINLEELENIQRNEFTNFFLKNYSEIGLPRFLKNFREEIMDGVERTPKQPATLCEHLKHLAQNFHFPKNLKKSSNIEKSPNSQFNPCLTSTLPPNLSRNYFYNIS